MGVIPTADGREKPPITLSPLAISVRTQSSPKILRFDTPILTLAHAVPTLARHTKPNETNAWRETLARLARIDPALLYPVKHRSAQAQTDLAMIRARAGLVRTRTALVNTARNLAKSFGDYVRDDKRVWQDSVPRARTSPPPRGDSNLLMNSPANRKSYRLEET